MHIPDGYLSPQTCAVLTVTMLPFWATAVKKIKQSLSTRYVPMMVIGAAFTFIIMMFNIPIPDGTTAHAVGGGIVAVILGPWAASICITIALAIQALLFGDGGIWAFGANSFNMAVVLPFSAYLVYRLVAGKTGPSSPRRWIGCFAGGYVGINLAALCAGVEFGLQPVLFHTANGAPLYSPYPLGMAVSAMAFAHVLIAGPVEGLVTALVMRYLQASNPQLLQMEQQALLSHNGVNKLWWALGALAVISPLGLLARGTAWGEWGLEEIKSRFGTIPTGMASLADQWHSLMPDYTLPGMGNAFWHSAGGYILAAVIGIAGIVAITYLFGRLAAALDRAER